MALQDAYPCVVVKAVPTDTATTDGASVDIPYTGNGYVVRAVYFYNSRILSTGATANNATATLGVFGASGGSSPTIVADAALTTHTGSTIVSSRTVAATGTTPLVTAKTLYIRTGTASGVTGSGVDVIIEYSVLP
ncbi:MAG: hypothetical protein IPK75_18480 [Acidobacteria bacterium]|jgi:hypothetical protein|nr:hypothetical protein [Acidobacteriota bacterium]